LAWAKALRPSREEVVPDPSSSAPLLISFALATSFLHSLRSGKEWELIGGILMSTNYDCRGVGQFGGRLESNNDRVLPPWMREFSDGDISLRLVGDLFCQPLPAALDSLTYLLDGLVQEMLRLFSCFRSIVPSPESRELGEERSHVINIEGFVHLLDCLGLFSGFGVF